MPHNRKPKTKRRQSLGSENLDSKLESARPKSRIPYIRYILCFSTTHPRWVAYPRYQLGVHMQTVRFSRIYSLRSDLLTKATNRRRTSSNWSPNYRSFPLSNSSEPTSYTNLTKITLKRLNHLTSKTNQLPQVWTWFGVAMSKHEQFRWSIQWAMFVQLRIKFHDMHNKFAVLSVIFWTAA